MIKSFSEAGTKILNVFDAARPAEDSDFRGDYKNVQLMFHASAPSNFVGILSR